MGGLCGHVGHAAICRRFKAARKTQAAGYHSGRPAVSPAVPGVTGRELRDAGDRRWNLCRILCNLWVADGFNSFGALAVAASLYGAGGAVMHRYLANIIGIVLAVVFYSVFEYLSGRMNAAETVSE